MKYSIRLFLLLLCPLLAASEGEKNLSPRFERTQPIDGTFRAGKRGRLTVSADVFGQSRNFPNDMRILDADGIQWPFFLHVPKKTVAAKRLVPEILNRAFVPGAEPYLQFDLVLPPHNGTARTHNRMELTTSGRDFVRRVEVFTADPEPSRGRIAAGYLINFSSQRNARNRLIRYPASDVQRLHVRIYSNARAADETFRLISAGLHYRTVVEVEREPVTAVQLEVPEREQEKGAQTFLFDLEHTGRPVEFITFHVKNASYARSVSVYGRDNDREPWKWVGGGVIHALKDDEKKEVTLDTRQRFLKVHLFHYDDQPLVLEAVELEAVPRYLVFEAASDGQASLYFRAWDMKPARYDLKGRIDEEAIAKLPQFRTLETKANEAVKAQPWRKYSRLLAGLAVAAVSVLVLWIIVGMLRQQKETQEP